MNRQRPRVVTAGVSSRSVCSGSAGAIGPSGGCTGRSCHRLNPCQRPAAASAENRTARTCMGADYPGAAHRQAVCAAHAPAARRVTPLTDSSSGASASRRRRAKSQDMSMVQLVIGAACGFLVAQGVLYGLARLIGWLRQGDLVARARAVRATPAPTVLGALIRYAAPVGVSVALLTLGVWAVSDYLSAKSARNAE